MTRGDRFAVIDLGSNSFRLVVFMTADGWWRRTDEIYEPVRIGEGMAATGRLGEEPMRRALATLDVFDQFCRAAGLIAAAEQSGAAGGSDGLMAGVAVDALATSAIRDAENAEGFLALAREHTSLPIRVLSRETEARYGYLAAVNSTTLTDGCVLDLGGGSLQLVRVAGRRACELGSWRLGAVRMTERYLPVNGPPKRRQIDELREHVADDLAGAEWLTDAGRASGGGRLVGMGGTVRNLAAAVQRAKALPSNGVQGMTVAPAELDELIEQLAALPASKRSAVPGIKPARADLVLAGAIVVQGVIEAGGFAGLEVTESGLREGVFFERLLSDRDPPLFTDIRRDSVLNRAAQYRHDRAHTEHVATLALAMFDELARLGLHAGDPLERELLWAACALHDVGMAVDYDDHHKHSRYLILNGGLPGYSPREVAIIAQATRYHRKGMPEPGPLAALFEPGDAARLDRCAVLLRLAEDLERSRDQLVRATRFTLAGSNGSGEIELRLIADGEPTVPRWAASRERELFERAFHRELLVAA
ncbi:MAG TPA: Ppx/GppA phosphatase family protein [Solirubrobacteraceae bacterium]|nr:Ppx/GppA phosphatase family protein [Solirubrobacteraceae bacterium]